MSHLQNQRNYFIAVSWHFKLIFMTKMMQQFTDIHAFAKINHPCTKKHTQGRNRNLNRILHENKPGYFIYWHDFIFKNFSLNSKAANFSISSAVFARKGWGAQTNPVPCLLQIYKEKKSLDQLYWFLSSQHVCKVLLVWQIFSPVIFAILGGFSLVPVMFHQEVAAAGLGPCQSSANFTWSWLWTLPLSHFALPFLLNFASSLPILRAIKPKLLIRKQHKGSPYWQHFPDP